MARRNALADDPPAALAVFSTALAPALDAELLGHDLGQRRALYLLAGARVFPDVLAFRLPPKQALAFAIIADREKAVELAADGCLDLDHLALRPAGEQVRLVGFGQPISSDTTRGG